MVPMFQVVCFACSLLTLLKLSPCAVKPTEVFLKIIQFGINSENQNSAGPV
jgi:hypothetical protein